MTDNTNQGNKSIGTVAGIDVSEIKGQRWEYVLAFSFFFGFLGCAWFFLGCLVCRVPFWLFFTGIWGFGWRLGGRHFVRFCLRVFFFGGAVFVFDLF